MSGPLVLVSCVAAKLDRAAPARELYCSDWFRKARAYVEAQAAPWAILSALHGVLEPDQVVGPYDVSLHGMSRREREVWGCRVVDALGDRVEIGGSVVLLAGEIYRKPILDCWLWRSRKYQATAPLAGLGIGMQKKWLADRLACLGGRL